MAITLKNPASDIASALNGQSIEGETMLLNDNLWSRPVHPVPGSLQVVLINNGGGAPSPYAGTTASAFFSARVQVIVYGYPGADGYDQGSAVARGVFGYLQQIGTTLSGYVSAMCVQSQPLFNGLLPDSDQAFWSFDVDCWYTA